MIISLDYDDTYTRDPDLWNRFIHTAKEKGHEIYCVTMRYPHEGQPVELALRNRVKDIIYTKRLGKRSYMYSLGISVDVWIDDAPGWILHDAADAVETSSGVLAPAWVDQD